MKVLALAFMAFVLSLFADQAFACSRYQSTQYGGAMTHTRGDCAPNLEYRHNGATHYPDNRRSARRANTSRQQSYQYQYHRSERGRSVNRRNASRPAPRITGTMPVPTQAKSFRVLGAPSLPQGVPYHFGTVASADQAPKVVCQVIATGLSADGMTRYTRRICPD